MNSTEFDIKLTQKLFILGKTQILVGNQCYVLRQNIQKYVFTYLWFLMWFHHHRLKRRDEGKSRQFGHCSQGVPTELALLSLLGAFAVAYGILYTASTMNAGRRKKRGSSSSSAPVPNLEKMLDLIWMGKFPFSILSKSCLSLLISSMIHGSNCHNNNSRHALKDVEKNCGVIIAPVKTGKKEGVKMFITHLLIVAGSSANQAWSSSEIRKWNIVWQTLPAGDICSNSAPNPLIISKQERHCFTLLFYRNNFY